MSSKYKATWLQSTLERINDKMCAWWRQLSGNDRPSAGHFHRAWKLHAFDIMRIAYMALIIEGALITVILVCLNAGSRQIFAIESPGIVALLLAGYIATEQILLSFSQGRVVTLGFPFILLTTLIEGPIVAWGMATFGSSVSEILRNHCLYRDMVPNSARKWRPLFYASYQSLAAMTAAMAYIWVSNTFTALLDLEQIHIQAILVYIVTYGLIAQLLIWPHDWLINRLVMPDQVRFPRVDVLSALLVMTPIPVVLFFVYLQTSAINPWIFIAILLPAFIVLLSLMRSYVNVEKERNRLAVVDFVNRQLRESDGTMLDLTHRLMEIVFQLVRFEDIAIYAAEEKGNTLILRGRKEEYYQTVTYDLADTPPFDEDAHDVPQWLPQIEPGNTLLGEPLRDGKIRVWNDPPFRESNDPRPMQLISNLPIAILPLEAQGSGVIGQIIVTKRSFVLAERTRLEMFVNEVGNLFRVVQMHEWQIRNLYSQLKDFTRDQEQTQLAIADLVQLGVDLGRILSKISQQSYDTNLRLILNDIIRGEKGLRPLSLPKDTLIKIYEEVRGETPGMPPPTEEILNKINAIISSLSLAFTFRYQFPDIPRGPEFNRLYQKFLAALEADTIGAIIEYAQETETTLPPADSTATESARAANVQLSQLRKVGSHLARYKKTDDTDAWPRHLHRACDMLDEQERAIQRLSDPERFIFLNIINTWREAITTTLRACERGQAALRMALTANRALLLEEVTLGLRLENAGTASATHMCATLLPADDYEVVQGEAIVGLLAGGRICEVEFLIKPCVQDQIRPQFQVTFNDGQRPDRRETFADVVYLRGAPPPFHHIQSPYVAGRPLPPGSNVFFGRDDIFDFVETNTNARTRESILLLTGERRVGKTSIAKQLLVRLAKKGYLAAYLDCQSLGIDEGTHNFFLAVCDAIVESVEDTLNLPCTSPDYDELLARPQHVFERVFLPQVRELIGDKVLLLIIDEFEVLEDRVERRKLDPDIFDYLRHLMQHKDGLGFIFIGTHTLQQLATEYWSVLFNIAKHYRIGFLSRAPTADLITQPVYEDGMRYDDLAVQKIIGVTGGHPYFTQLICDFLVGVCNNEGRSYVTAQDVRDALDPIVEIGGMHLSYVWLESTPPEKSVLYALTTLLDIELRATQAAISDRVKYLGLGTDPNEISHALERLNQRSILRRSPGVITYYDFAVDLYRQWIKKYKVLDNVLGEVLDGRNDSGPRSESSE